MHVNALFNINAFQEHLQVNPYLAPRSDSTASQVKLTSGGLRISLAQKPIPLIHHIRYCLKDANHCISVDGRDQAVIDSRYPLFALQQISDVEVEL